MPAGNENVTSVAETDVGASGAPPSVNVKPGTNPAPTIVTTALAVALNGEIFEIDGGPTGRTASSTALVSPSVNGEAESNVTACIVISSGKVMMLDGILIVCGVGKAGSKPLLTLNVFASNNSAGLSGTIGKHASPKLRLVPGAPG